MTHVFVPGERVTWLTPDDLAHWEAQYKKLLRDHGPGPFTVLEAVRALKTVPKQDVTLSYPDGTAVVDTLGKKVKFYSTWLKLSDM